ncbi:hypothetical protein D1007_34515 [Hordeum vulgare]|nr:hypothetical protein D1007_34515 [Hordeum vulgare]
MPAIAQPDRTSALSFFRCPCAQASDRPARAHVTTAVLPLLAGCGCSSAAPAAVLPLLVGPARQEDMKEFRRKLVVILLETELNKLKGSPIYHEPDNEGKLDVCDDRKHPHDLVDKICNDIMSINDADSLEKEWVRSSKPHPIGLSLRRIQGILCRDRSLDIDCFNMAIRILACDKALLAVDPLVRYMDLQFSTAVTGAALASARDLDSRVQPDIEALAALLRSWTEIERNISSCNLMARIDINEVPDEFHGCDVGPPYCTHAQTERVPISIKVVGESLELGASPVQDGLV